MPAPSRCPQHGPMTRTAAPRLRRPRHVTALTEAIPGGRHVTTEVPWQASETDQERKPVGS